MICLMVEPLATMDGTVYVAHCGERFEEWDSEKITSHRYEVKKDLVTCEKCQEVLDE